jgi:hypothetical protein
MEIGLRRRLVYESSCEKEGKTYPVLLALGLTSENSLWAISIDKAFDEFIER